jgi:hypothetical protein
MVGKKASLKTLREVMQAYGIPRNHIFETSFIQGVTNRWAIAWTFSSQAAALFQTYTLLNATKATDRTAVSMTTTAAESDASVPSTSASCSREPVTAATHQELVRLVAFSSALFQSTMLKAEKLAPYPSEIAQQLHTTPSSASTSASSSQATTMMFLGRCLQRLESCIEQLGSHLSQQHFQGFESITFMTPLGHINSVQWNVHVSRETRYRPNFCEVHCRLSILTSGAEAIPSSSSSVSLHSVKTEALKPLIDLCFAVSLSSSSAPSSKASMDIDQVDSHTEEGDEDVHIAVTMILTNSYCAAGLASKLVQRSKDFLEPELERTNRRFGIVLLMLSSTFVNETKRITLFVYRWRRALQRDVDGGGATAAGSSANSIEAQTSGP